MNTLTTTSLSIWEIGSVIFFAGIIWERLHAVNRKLTEMNGKVGTSLEKIGNLEVRVAKQDEVLSQFHCQKEGHCCHEE